MKSGLGVPEIPAEQPRSIKRENLSYKRTSFRPSYRMKGREVIPTKKREYQDDRGLVQEDERPLLEGLGNSKQDGRKRTKVK